MGCHCLLHREGQEDRISYVGKNVSFYSTKGKECLPGGKESACSTGDLGSTRSPGEKKGYPLQYSGLENSMSCIAHGATKSQTRLSDFHFFHFMKAEKIQEDSVFLEEGRNPKHEIPLRN